MYLLWLKIPLWETGPQEQNTAGVALELAF